MLFILLLGLLQASHGSPTREEQSGPTPAPPTTVTPRGLNSSPNIDNIEIEAFPQARGRLSSSNIENADEDFPLEANADLLKLPGTLYKANANSSVHISKKKHLRGIITSENFPNNYPTSVHDLSNKIPHISGDFLAIEFTDFDVESHSKCAFDWLLIEDRRGYELLPKTCGSSIPKTIYAQTRKLKFPVFVIFHSDDSVTKKGFRLEWRSQQAGPTPAPPTTVTDIPGGLLIAGGWDATYRVEVYSPGAGYHCELPRLPYQREGHTSEAGELCGGHHNSKTCTTFSSGKWVSSRALAEKRYIHTSWHNKEQGKIFLMGGEYSGRTTETLTVGANDDGVPGFPLKYDTQQACAIADQTTVIITGGTYTQHIVSRYGTAGHIEDLPSLNQGRRNHGCGSYTDDNGGKVFLVVGGNDGSNKLSSTEMLTRTSSAWVMVKSLPRKMQAMTGGTLGNILYMTGGYDGNNRYRDEIYQWTGQDWEEVGKMKKARSLHTVSIISLDEIEDLCN